VGGLAVNAQSGCGHFSTPRHVRYTLEVRDFPQAIAQPVYKSVFSWLLRRVATQDCLPSGHTGKLAGSAAPLPEPTLPSSFDNVEPRTVSLDSFRADTCTRGTDGDSFGTVETVYEADVVISDREVGTMQSSSSESKMSSVAAI
jgi:hypothetical protein